MSYVIVRPEDSKAVQDFLHKLKTTNTLSNISVIKTTVAPSKRNKAQAKPDKLAPENSLKPAEPTPAKPAEPAPEKPAETTPAKREIKNGVTESMILHSMEML